MSNGSEAGLDTLLPELIRVASSFLDEASCFCFSLVSKRYGAILEADRVDGFAFTRACASRGHFELLKWAHSLGCPIHPQTFALFGPYSSVTAFRWFWNARIEGDPTAAELYPWLKRGNADVIEAMTALLSQKWSRVLARALARAGQVAQLNTLLEAHPGIIRELNSKCDVLEELACSGNFGVGMGLATQVPNALEWRALRSGALDCGDLEVVRLCFNRAVSFFDRDGEWSYPMQSNFAERHLPCFAYLMDECMDTVDLGWIKAYLIRQALSQGSVILLRFLHQKYNVVPTLEDMTKMIAKAAREPVPNAAERFECIRFSTEASNISWEPAPFRFPEYSFFSKTQLQWLCSRGLVIPPEFEIDLFKRLDRILAGKPAEVDWLEFLFQRGGRITDENLLHASKNYSLPLLVTLLSLSAKYGTVMDLKDIYFSISDVMKTSFVAKPIHYGSLIKILDWFASQGVAWDDAKIQKTIEPISNRYFLLEIQKLQVKYNH